MNTESELSNQAISHKGEKRKSYWTEFNNDVVKYAKENSAKEFKVDSKRVCEWVQDDNKLLFLKESQCRIDSGGKKLTDFKLEEQVLSWIHELRANMLRVSRKIIMFKAKSIYDEKCANNQAIHY